MWASGGDETGFVQSVDTAGRRIEGKRFVGNEVELADSAVGHEVCLAVLQVNRPPQNTRSKRLYDDQNDDERGGDPGELVHDPKRAIVERPRT